MSFHLADLSGPFVVDRAPAPYLEYEYDLFLELGEVDLGASLFHIPADVPEHEEASLLDFASAMLFTWDDANGGQSVGDIDAYVDGDTLTLRVSLSKHPLLDELEAGCVPVTWHTAYFDVDRSDWVTDGPDGM